MSVNIYYTKRGKTLIKKKNLDKKIQNNELSENSLLSLAVVLNDSK